MAGSGPYYSDGRYACVITDQGISSARSGNVQIVLKFRVLKQTQPVQDVAQQYERTMWLTVTEKTLVYLIPKLRGLGYDRDGISFIDLSNPRHHDLRGREFEAYCQHEVNENSGEDRERWDIASRGSKPLELQAPESKALRNMDMLFARAAENLGQSAPAPVGPQAVPANTQSITDEDVPF